MAQVQLSQLLDHMQHLSEKRDTTGKLLRVLIIASSLLGLGMLSLMIDADITRLRHSQLISGDVRRIIQLSEIFGHGFGIAIAIYLMWLLAPDKRRMIPRLATCAILPGLLALCIKLLVLRHRPGFYYPEFTDQVTETWVGLATASTLNHDYLTQSFPSAHAATATGLAIGLSWLYPKGRFAFLGLASMASFQRVFAGAHWTSDVFAGAAVGVLVCGYVIGNHQVNKLFAVVERIPTAPNRITGSKSKRAKNRRFKPVRKAA